MTPERDYIKFIGYIAGIWFSAMIFHQIVFSQLTYLRDIPFLFSMVASGRLTLVYAIFGSIIAWKKTAPPTEVDSNIPSPLGAELDQSNVSSDIVENNLEAKEEILQILPQEKKPEVQHMVEPEVSIEKPEIDNIISTENPIVYPSLEETNQSINIETIPKNMRLALKLDLLQRRFPVTVDNMTATVRHGVISYRRKRNLTQFKTYYFEDFMNMSDDEYDKHCMMHIQPGISLDIYEDLEYIRRNDIPQHYDTKYMLNYFKDQYSIHDDNINTIKNQILRHNWKMAGQERKRIINNE